MGPLLLQQNTLIVRLSPINIPQECQDHQQYQCNVQNHSNPLGVNDSHETENVKEDYLAMDILLGGVGEVGGVGHLPKKSQ